MASLIDLLPPINEDDYNKWQADTVGRLMGRRIKSLDQPAPAPPQPDYSSYGQRPAELPPEPAPQPPPPPDYMSYGQRPPEPPPEPPPPAPSFQEAAPYQDTQTAPAPPPPDSIASYQPGIVEQASDTAGSFLDYANQKIASLGTTASDAGSSFLDYANQKIASLGQPSTSSAPPPVAPTPDMTLAQPFQDAAARPFADAPVPQAIGQAATTARDFLNPEYDLQNQAFDQRLAGLPLTPEQAAAEQRQINAIAMSSGGPIKIVGGKVLGAIGGKALGAVGSKAGSEVVGAVEGAARVAGEVKAAEPLAKAANILRDIPFMKPTLPPIEQVPELNRVWTKRTLVNGKWVDQRLDRFTPTVYRETSARDAVDYFLGNNSTPEYPGITHGSMDEYYVASTPTLALGQNQGKGVVLELDASKAEGVLSTSKPMWQPAYNNGEAELKARFPTPQDQAAAVRSVTMLPSAPLRKIDSILFKRAVAGWDKVVNADSSVTYRRPTASASAVESLATGGGTLPIESLAADMTRPVDKSVVRPSGDLSQMFPGEAGALNLPPNTNYERPVDAVNAAVHDSYFGEPTPIPGTPIRTKLDNVWRGVKREMTDNLVDLKDAQKRAESAVGRPLNADEQAYLYARLQPGSAMVGKMALQDHLKPALTMVGDDQNNLSILLTHQHNLDVATQIGKRVEAQAIATGQTPVAAAALGKTASDARKFSGGLNLADSQAGLAAMAQELGPQRFQTVQDAAKQVGQAVEWGRKQLLDSGVWDKATYNKLKQQYPNYVPTKILDYMDEQSSQLASGKKLGLNDNQLRSLTEEGTVRVREDPLASVERMVLQAANASAKNNTFNAFVKLRDLTPDMKLSIKPIAAGYEAKNGESIIGGFVQGTRQRFAVPSDLAALVEQAPTNSPTIQKFNVVMGIYKTLITSKNIAFAVGQMPMDAMNYAIRESVNSGGPQHIPSLMLDYAKAIPDAFNGIFQNEYRGTTGDLMRSSGGLFGYTSMTPKGAEAGLRALGRSNILDIRTKADLLDAVKSVAKLEPVSAVAERAEMTPRVATYNRAIRRGESTQEAALKARDLIDFSLGGHTTKVLNGFIPFFNVGFQGLAMPYRALRQDPKAFIGTAAALLAGPTLVAEAWNRQNPQMERDYEDVPQSVKDQGIVVMIPGQAPTDARGNRHPQFTLLRGREFTPFMIAAREAAQATIGKSSGRGVPEILRVALGQMSPIQATDAAGLFGVGLPPGIRQGLEVGLNRNLYTGSMIATDRMNQQAGGVAQGIAKGLQDTGLSKNAQPAHVQYTISSLTGGPGKMALSAESALEGKSNPTQGGPAAIPVIGDMARRFVRGDVGDFLYKAQDKAVSDPIDKALRHYGVTYRWTPVSYMLNGKQMRIQDQAYYQTKANTYINQDVMDLVRDSEWRSLPVSEKEQELQQVVGVARDRAKTETVERFGDRYAKP